MGGAACLVTVIFLYFVVDQPSEQFIGACLTGCNTQDDILQFFLRVVQFNSIEAKKHQHCMGPCTFISIQKWMILDHAIPKACGFLLNRWINIFAAKALKRSFLRRLEQSFIPHTRHTAGFFQ